MHLKNIKLKYFQIIVGILLLLSLIFLVGFEKLFFETMIHIDIKWFLCAVVCIFITTIIGAYNSFLFINHDARIKWSLFLPIYWMSWAMSLVVPGQVGDIASISVLLRKHNFDWHNSIGRGLLDKAISFTVNLAYGLTGLFIIDILQNINTSYFIYIFLVLLFLIFTIAMLIKHRHIYTKKWKTILALISNIINEFFNVAKRHPVLLVINIK